MAGMWQDIRFNNITAHKTKAHRSKKQATLQGDLQEWIGNDVVDDLAKEAAAMGAPSKDVVRSREADVANRVAFYHFAAKTAQFVGAEPARATQGQNRTAGKHKGCTPLGMAPIPSQMGVWAMPEKIQNQSNQCQQHMLWFFSGCHASSHKSPSTRPQANGLQLFAGSWVFPVLQQVRLLLPGEGDRLRQNLCGQGRQPVAPAAQAHSGWPAPHHRRAAR
jgi:hypothetical protein